MKLGVGIVTYNRLEQLQIVIDKVQKFTTGEWYLVVADDGSIDGTREFCESRSITRVGDRNRGIAWNKNRALYTLRHWTEAEVILLLEDDTVPTGTDWQFDWMRAAELYGYATYAHPKVSGGIMDGAGTVNNPYGCRNITSQCAVVSIAALDTVGYFDTRFRGYGVEDGEWTTRLRSRGYGVRNVLGAKGVTKTNLMLATGVETIDSTSYRNNEEVSHNRKVFTQVRSDPIPRLAWISDDEKAILEGEIDAALRRQPLHLRATGKAVGEATPYPWLRHIPRPVARAASLAGVTRPTAETVGQVVALSSIYRPGQTLADIQTAWSVMPTVTVQIDDRSRKELVGLVALNRFHLIRSEQLDDDLGFLSEESQPVNRIPVMGRLDYNFDLAMDLFVPPAVSQICPWQPRKTVLRESYTHDGIIPLLISTKQTDIEQIGKSGNVGDNFGLHVTRRLANMPVQPYGVWADKTSPMMLSIGSFIQHARDRGLVWGTGAVTAEPWKENATATRSTFLGVRGPRTREHLLRRFGIAPPVIVDPGVLIPQVVAKLSGSPRHEVGFIIHNLDLPTFNARSGPQFIVENRSSPERLIEDISQCKRIVTSSLHGWIFCQALGVPVVVVALSDNIPGGEFKFVDFAQSVGAYDFIARIDLRNIKMFSDDLWPALVEEHHRQFSISTAALLESFPF